MTSRIGTFSAATVFLNIFCLAFASAQITETKLVPSDVALRDESGVSVSISGDFALVGAHGDDDNGMDSGSAYVFHFDGLVWVEQAKLVALDAAANDKFGFSVFISGEYALIGAPHSRNSLGKSTGSVYIFHFDGSNWMQQAKLVAGDGKASDLFGWSVSLNGDYALIGARQDSHSKTTNAGSAYIFHLEGSDWIEQAKLTASDINEDDYFGHSVSLSGEYALVGAPQDDGNLGNEAGSAYIFHYDGSNWVEQARLYSSTLPDDDNFGVSVSLQGSNAFVGAVFDSENETNGGAVYVFYNEGSKWVRNAKLYASDAGDFDFFGYSVSLSGDYALVGATGDNGGSAYIFHFDGSNWTEQTKLTASDGDPNDYFGQSVSLSGDHAVVGAHGYEDDGGPNNTGTTYVYSARPACKRISQFQGRCRAGGLIKARVIMADASHEGDILEISIDDVPYEVIIDATGRGQLSQGGFSSGPHTVELTDPGQCFDPIVVTCRTSLDKVGSDDWDDELVSDAPTETTLLGNYPNPFNPSTTIRYTLSVNSPVSIRVYNMLGQEVATLVDGFQKAGEQSVTWHGVNNFGQAVASGLYIYRLQAGNRTLSQKMLFAK